MAVGVKQKEMLLRNIVEKERSSRSQPEWKKVTEGVKVNSRLLIWRLATQQFVKERTVWEWEMGSGLASLSTVMLRKLINLLGLNGPVCKIDTTILCMELWELLLLLFFCITPTPFGARAGKYGNSLQTGKLRGKGILMEGKKSHSQELRIHKVCNRLVPEGREGC